MNNFLKRLNRGNALAVQWLELCAFTTRGMGSVPGQGTKILQALWRSQKKKKLNRKEFIWFRTRSLLRSIAVCCGSCLLRGGQGAAS